MTIVEMLQYIPRAGHQALATAELNALVGNN